MGIKVLCPQLAISSLCFIRPTASNHDFTTSKGTVWEPKKTPV